MRILKALFFWPMVTVFTIYKVLQMSLVSLKYRFTKPEERSNACHEVASQWGVGIIKLTPGWDYRIRGRDNIPKASDKPVVVVANHQSAVDIWALYALGIQFRWLSKIEVFRLPFVGQAMTMCGYIPITRGSKDSHNQAFEDSRQWIRKGVSMAYFPEGSRSKDGKLKSFKTGAFRLAELESVDVLPVALIGTNQMMAKNAFIPNPSLVDIRVLPATRQEAGETCEAFMNRVRQDLSAELEKAHIQASQNAPVLNPARVST